MQMMKKLSLLFILTFLSVQLFSIVHMAERGFLEHKHHGHDCEISLFFEHNNASDVPTAISVPVNATFATLALTYSSSVILPLEYYNSTEPRAPPAISFI
jgi:hypothetical protein